MSSGGSPRLHSFHTLTGTKGAGLVCTDRLQTRSGWLSGPHPHPESALGLQLTWGMQPVTTDTWRARPDRRCSGDTSPAAAEGGLPCLSSLPVEIFNGNTLTQLCFMYPVASKTKTIPLRYPAIKEVEHSGKLLQILSAISSISASLFISSQITNYRMWKSPYR